MSEAAKPKAAPAPAAKPGAAAPAKGPAPAAKSGAAPSARPGGPGAKPGAAKAPVKKELPCFNFPFDARSKPITEQMLQLEAKAMKSFFGKKPKKPISDMAVLLDSKAGPKELLPAIRDCVSFYKQDDKDGERYLEVLGRLFLEAAAKETSDPTQQRFLLYQSIDIFSMAIQRSAKSLNVNVENMIVSVFKITAGINPSAYHIEKEIHKDMNTMVTQKKDPNDLELRDRIIKLNMQGKRYYEALYQLIELEKIMQLKSRSMYMLKHGELQFRKATVFQHMIDFYIGVAARREQQEAVVDMGKLRSFIFRFNIDNRRFHLLPLANTGALAISKTVASLIVVANFYYNQAANDTRFPHRHKAFYCMAHNNVMTDKVKSAINFLLSGIEALAKSPLKAIDKGNEKLRLLEYVAKLYNDQGAPRKAEEYQKQLNELRANVRTMESQKRAQEKQSAELADLQQSAISKEQAKGKEDKTKKPAG